MSISTQTATLVAAAIAALASIFTLLISSRLTSRRERRQFILNKEIERFFVLEEVAGELLELVGNDRSFETKLEALVDRLEQIELIGGRFARYPRVNQATRDFGRSVRGCSQILATDRTIVRRGKN
jgi:hypothetical protein